VVDATMRGAVSRVAQAAFTATVEPETTKAIQNVLLRSMLNSRRERSERAANVFFRDSV